VLRLSGHKVHVAAEGPEALALARRLLPEVVFIDIGLVGMDGNEVARRLRGEAELSGAVLVALTGWVGPEERQRSLEAGFDHHLYKPADLRAVEQLMAFPGTGRAT
jgi:two-component system CheB/CheR fusion protein